MYINTEKIPLKLVKDQLDAKDREIGIFSYTKDRCLDSES